MAQVKAGKVVVGTLLVAGPLSIGLLGINVGPGACESNKCPDGNYKCVLADGSRTCKCPPIGSATEPVPGSHLFADDQGNTWLFLVP